MLLLLPSYQHGSCCRVYIHILSSSTKFQTAKFFLFVCFFWRQSKHIPNWQTFKICLWDTHIRAYPVSSTGLPEKLQPSNPAGLFCCLYYHNKQTTQNNQRKQLRQTQPPLSPLLPFSSGSMGMSRHSSRHTNAEKPNGKVWTSPARSTDGSDITASSPWTLG